MSTVVANFNTYLFSDVPFERQLFHPADSTLLAQWRLWPRQVAAWRQYDHTVRASGAQFYVIDEGFYDVEVPEMAPFGRWMGESGRLRIYARPQQDLTVRVAYSRPRPTEGGAVDPLGLHFVYDGTPVVGERRQVAENERQTQWVDTLTIPASDVNIFPGTFVLTSTTWTPLELGDPRELSVFVERVEVLSDGLSLAAIEANLPRPLPVSTAYPWSWEAMFWFYDPLSAHPLDVWPWYIWTSGLPLAQAQRFIVILISALGACFVASGVWFIRSVKQSLQ